MLENIRLSFQGIWSHKMRSFLTMLGIIIGIASIISIVSTIKGTNEQIKKDLIGAGNNTVSVKLYQGDSEFYFSNEQPSGIGLLTDEQKEEIRNLEDVEFASFYNIREYVWDCVYYKNRQLEGQVLGIDRQYLATCGYVISEGRGFAQSDYDNFRKVAMVDETASKSLFQNENPIGKTVEINSEPFVIVGVVKKSTTFQPVINSMEDYTTYYGEQQSGFMMIPSACWCIPFNYDEVQNCVLRAVSTEKMSGAGQKAAEIMNETILNEDNNMKFRAADVLEKVKNMQELSASANKQLIWIASISLLVGGIGVMNIMLVSVTERTSEIGLKKAIGARKNRILAQFLTEAAVLTSLGGMVGVIAGIILAQAISRMSQTPVAISLPAIIGAVAFSMLIGIIFGLLPSVKAANLNPIDALRHE